MGPGGPMGGGGFGGPRMRGRGFGGNGPPMGPGPNGFGSPMRGRGFGNGGPRGPPHEGGWDGGPPFRGGPPRGMGGPPRGMMHGRGGGPPWGGPPQHGGWNDDEEDFDEMEMGRPDMRHHGGPPGDLGGPSGDMGMPGAEKPNPLGIDLSGEVWVETNVDLIWTTELKETHL